MKYLVRGKNSRTKQDGQWEVEAASEWEAAQQIEAMGVSVSDVKAVESKTPPTREVDPMAVVAEARKAETAPVEVPLPQSYRPVVDAKLDALRSQARTIVMGLGIFFILRTLGDCGIMQISNLRPRDPSVMILNIVIQIGLGIVMWAISPGIKRGYKAQTITALVLLIIVGLLALLGLIMMLAIMIKGFVPLDSYGMTQLIGVLIMVVLSLAGIMRIIQILAYRKSAPGFEVQP